MTYRASIRIEALPDPQPIDRRIYGHFLESAFFGNIENGVFDEGSPLSVDGDGPLRGCRVDVIEALRELGLPIVRWPGGNFASPYWWQDGTGPREQRPRRLELAWGSEESNRFGTPEFLAWCEAVGTEPYLTHSARSVDDAVRWVEYTNYAGDTTMTRRRAGDGHPDPWGVRTWGLGNEVFGDWQMGHRSVADYVAAAREHARFMRLVDPGLRFVAVGLDEASWTEQVVAGLGDLVDHVSLHVYGASRHLTDSSEAEFDAVVAQSVYVEQAIADRSDTIARTRLRHGYQRPLAIALDEWNMRHLEPASWPDPQPGADGGVADRFLVTDAFSRASLPESRVNRYSPRTLADGLFHAGVFHALHRASQREVPVTMANTVNLVNANGLIAVRPDGLVRAATYHLWDLYQNHTGEIPLAASVLGPARTALLRLGDTRIGDEFRTRHATIDLLDVSASTTPDGSRLFVAVLNRSASEPVTAVLEIPGVDLPGTVTRRTFGADAGDLFAANSMTNEAVRTVTETVRGDQRSQRFPAHSVTVLEFAVDQKPRRAEGAR